MCLILIFRLVQISSVCLLFGCLTCTIPFRLLAFAYDQFILCVYTSISNSTVSVEFRVA